jgi:hypothetical protein
MTPDNFAAIMTAEVVEKAKALNIRATDLANSLEKAMLLMKDEPFAFLAIRDGDIVHTAIAPAKEGKITVPPCAELILAFGRSPSGLRALDMTVLHDDGCPAIESGLMTECNCSPYLVMDEVHEA